MNVIVTALQQEGQGAKVRAGNGSKNARAQTHSKVGRVVIVSNRVSPISALKSAPGGLAIAMRAALGERPAVWFGWSGTLSDEPVAAPEISVDGNVTRALIDLPRDDFNRYYSGFANRALWPLFHYRIGIVEFSYEDYAAYRRINAEFARHLAPLLQPDDLVWVHDYHLIPLASELRALGVQRRMGFFLHTPFPAPDVLTTLPAHQEIVRMLADYDLIGFQTANDARAFTDYIQREVGGTVRRDGAVHAFGHRFRVGDFPIGIDPDGTQNRARSALSSARGRRLRESLSGRKLIIGVDRLDYTKGLVQRFEAVEMMLDAHPDLRRGVVVLQIAPPTRGDVPEYRQVRAELNQMIGHINGRFGDPDLLPVRYLNKQFGQYILFGFFRISAAGLVTPLRDGMNLVAKEYVASQSPDDPGVLILSRFAGAAQQMDAALIVNPFDPKAMAAAMHRALTMPVEERRERHRTLMDTLKRTDINAWRDSYIAALSATSLRRTPRNAPATSDVASAPPAPGASDDSQKPG